MENWKTFVNQLVEQMGFSDFRVEVDDEHNHGAIFIYDNGVIVKENLPTLIESINHLLQLAAKRNNMPTVFFDVNNYRKEREHLISELARTAARKVSATKAELSLPAMNSYERRIVHVELAMHPGVTTESIGLGKERYVIIKPIVEEEKKAAS